MGAVRPKPRRSGAIRLRTSFEAGIYCVFIPNEATHTSGSQETYKLLFLYAVQPNQINNMPSSSTEKPGPKLTIHAGNKEQAHQHTLLLALAYVKGGQPEQKAKFLDEAARLVHRGDLREVTNTTDANDN